MNKYLFMLALPVSLASAYPTQTVANISIPVTQTEVKSQAQSIIDHYESRFRKLFQDREISLKQGKNRIKQTPNEHFDASLRPELEQLNAELVKQPLLVDAYRKRDTCIFPSESLTCASQLPLFMDNEQIPKPALSYSSLFTIVQDNSVGREFFAISYDPKDNLFLTNQFVVGDDWQRTVRYADQNRDGDFDGITTIEKNNGASIVTYDRGADKSIDAITRTLIISTQQYYDKFLQFDAQGDGVIDLIWHRGIEYDSKQQVQEVITEIDQNADGVVDGAHRVFQADDGSWKNEIRGTYDEKWDEFK